MLRNSTLSQVRKLWKIFAVLLGCFGILLLFVSIGRYTGSGHVPADMFKPFIGCLLIVYAAAAWIMNRTSWWISVSALSGAAILQGIVVGFFIRELFDVALLFILMGYLFNLFNPHSKKLFKS